MPFYEESVTLTTIISSRTKSERPLRAEHKRVSPLNSFGKRFCASMTIEAALALPLYIFFMCNVLYIMEAVRFQSTMNAALHETGMRMCEYAYFVGEGGELLDELTGAGNEQAAEEGADSGIALAMAGGQQAADGQAVTNTQDILDGISRAGVSAVLSESYVRSAIREYLGESYLENGPVQGGAEGISYLGSVIPDEDGCIDLQAVYSIRAFVPVLAPASYRQSNRFYAHPFTGYEINGSGEEEDPLEEEEMVFITDKSRTVYHRKKDCTYLVPQIREEPSGSIGSLRNEQGGKYYACETCHPALTGMVVVTSDGTRYHRDKNCSALYRNIVSIPLSEAKKTRHACVRCGGG